MTKKILGCLPLLLLIACMPPQEPPQVWLKDGASDRDKKADRYQCMQEAMDKAPTTVGGYSGPDLFGTYRSSSADMNVLLRKQLFQACMENKGWTLEQPTLQTSSPNGHM